MESYASGSHHEVEKKGASVIKDLISDDAMESFNLICELHNFKKGLTTKKHLSQTSTGSKFALMSAEEGCSLLENNNDDELESNENNNNTRSSNVINDNHIEFENIIIDEISISSDSSSSGEFTPVFHNKKS